MSRVALIASLQSQAAEDAEALWRDARAQAEAYRGELGRELERRTALDAQAAAAEARRLEDAAFATARRRAVELRSQAALDLSARLDRLARAELAAMRGERDAALFTALALELPPRNWARVRVNPVDEPLARELFPGAQIAGDPGVLGGLEVETEEGRIRVSNTLETRLENGWADILPGLIEHFLVARHEDRTAA